MTLSTHWGNATLDADAKQINALEEQGRVTGAPRGYDKALEDEFNKIKAQILGSSNGSGGKGSPGAGGKHASGSNGTAGSSGATTGSSGTAGSGTKGGSGTSGNSTTGGSGTAGGTGTAGGSGTAGGGGTSGSSGTPGTGTDGGGGAAGGSGTIGGASGTPNSLTASLGEITRITGSPKAATTIVGIIESLAPLLGLGAQKVKDAIGRAGENAAKFASTNTGDPGADATDGAKIAADAVKFIKGLKGGNDDMEKVANAVAKAIERGGIRAGQLVLDAAVAAAGVGGPGAAGEAVEAAEAVANATEAAASAFGGDVASVLTVAKAVGDQAKFGGAAAHAASNAVKARASSEKPGEFHREDVEQFEKDAHTAGKSVDGAVEIIKLAGGKAQDLADVAKIVVEASTFGAGTAKTAATAVVNSVRYNIKHTSAGHKNAVDCIGAAQKVYDTAETVDKHDGSVEDYSKALSAVANAAKFLGPAGANDAAEAFNNAITSGDGVHDAVDAAKAVADVLSNGKSSGLNHVQRGKLADSVRDASKSGSAAARDVANTFKSVMNSSHNKDKAVEAAKDVAEAAQDGGVKAADAIAKTAELGGIDAVKNAMKEVRLMKLLGGTPAEVAKMAELFPSAAAQGATKELVGFIEHYSSRFPLDKSDLYKLARAGVSAVSAAGAGDGLPLLSRAIGDVYKLSGNKEQLVEAASLAALELQDFTDAAGSNNKESGIEQFEKKLEAAEATASTPEEFLSSVRMDMDKVVAAPTQPGEFTSAGSVFTTNDPPSPLGPLKSKFNDSLNALTHDLQTGADKATIEKDAQQLAAVAGQLGNGMVQGVALLIGSGFYGDNSSALWHLQYAAPVDDPWLTLVNPLDQKDQTPLNEAYLKLEVDISSNADSKTVKADAQQVQQLAGSDHPGLADAANNIIVNIDNNNSYDQTASLNALMNNPSNATAAPPASPPPPPSSPPPPQATDETTAYQKLLDDLTNGGDVSSIAADAQRLAGLAIQNGDDHLAQVALDIGDEVLGTNLDIPALDGITDYGPSAVNALKNAAPGTPAAQGDA